MEVITAHLPMCARGVQACNLVAAGTHPRPHSALCRPGPREIRDAASMAGQAPPTHRGHGGAPRCHLPAPAHLRGPIMPPIPLLRAHAMRFHHGQIETMPNITHHGHKETMADILPPRRRDLLLPFRRLGFGVSVAAMQRWLLFVCNLHDAFNDVVGCNTSNARLMQAQDCRHA